MAAAEEVLGGLNRNCGIAAIGVRSDGLAEFLVERRSADKHDIVVAYALFLHRVDHDLHIGHGRRQKGRHAKDIGLLAFDRIEIVLDRIVDPQIDDVEAGPLHHHADKVFADVVNVALDGSDHHLAEFRCAGFGQKRTQDRHAGLHRIGRQQHFRHEENAVAKIDADDAHALDQCLGQHVIGCPAAFQEDVRRFLNLLLQTVIEIVMHLLNEFFVGKLRKNDVVVGHEFSSLVGGDVSDRPRPIDTRNYV